MRKVKVLCPEDNFDCPYCKNGECAIESPQIQCDVFDGFDVFDYILPEERTAFKKMNDENIAKKLREIANSLEDLRVKIYQECEPDSFYAKYKQFHDDLLFSYQSKIRDIANDIYPL